MKPNMIQLVVVVAVSVLAAIGLISLCVTLFTKNYAEPSVLVAIISITSGLVGSLTTLIVGRSRTEPVDQPPPNGNPPAPPQVNPPVVQPQP
jgi:hypothetical protein